MLRFDWLEPQGVRVVSVNAAAERFQPLDFRGAPTDENLWTWLRRRVVPSHRVHIQDMLLKLGYDAHDVRGIIHLSLGLSLNDVFWVVDDGFVGTWKEHNLYDNPFSETISLMAFTGGGSYRRQVWTTSPEFTTNGMLAKCWRREGGSVSLYKSGTEGAVNAGFEPYSEFYAAQIAEALGFPHAEYGLSMFKGRLCSTSPLFTSDKYGFVPAGRVMELREALSDLRFSKVFFFDALIFNTDRHMGNFGFLMDNDTNEIIGPAPIFDNGHGLFSLAVDRDGEGNEFDDLRTFISRVHPALYPKWLGFSGGVTDEMKECLRRLIGFRFKPHENYNLSTKRLRAIEDFLQKRINKIMQYGASADYFLNINEENGTVKGVNLEVGTVNVASGDAAAVRRAILDNMKADPFITLGELVELTGVSRRTLQRYVNALRQAGAVARVGPDKTGYWSVDEAAYETIFGVVRNPR